MPTGQSFHHHQGGRVAPVNQVLREQRPSLITGRYSAQTVPGSSQTTSEPQSYARAIGSATPTSSREGAQFPSPLSLSPNQNRNVKEVALCSPSSNATEDVQEGKAGTIRVHGKINRADISQLTINIHEGPLFEVRVETDNRARIVFQNLSNALDFIKSDSETMKSVGHGRFGPGYRAELIEVVEWDLPLRAMCQPVRERRRLSFARKGLFAGSMSPHKWRQDMRHVAGPGNIDFLWVFNSGNGESSDN
ncbi:hypothetical protein BDW69DRAFT_159825 [Aspergillus filifer]